MGRISPTPGLTRRRLLLDGTATVALAAAGCGRPPRNAMTPVTLPIRYDDRGGLFIDARVGSSAPRRFILDTGASRSTLSPKFAKEIGLQLGGAGHIEGTAGTAASRHARAVLSLPGAFTGPVDFAVYDFGSYDPECVGILGYEVLHRAPFELRYHAGEMRWDARMPAERPIPLRIDHRVPRITASLQGVAIDLRLDTGATFPPGPNWYLNLAPSQAAALHLGARKPWKVFTASGTGGATLRLPVYEVEHLVLGAVDVPEARAIVQPKVGYFAHANAVGFLGNSALDKLDPRFDYRAGTLAVRTS